MDTVYKYDVLKPQYVVENLGKGKTVLVIDFKTMRVMDCVDMTVRTIQTFIDSTDTVFYIKTEVTA